MRDPQFYLSAAALSAGLAGGVAWAITPAVRELALRCGAAHAPRARDVHQHPVPRWGGLAIYAAFVVALVVAALAIHFGFHHHIGARTLRQGIGLVLAGGILSAVGALDDRYELSAGKQMLAQLACAALVMYFGVVIEFVSNPAG